MVLNEVFVARRRTSLEFLNVPNGGVNMKSEAWRIHASDSPIYAQSETIGILLCRSVWEDGNGVERSKNSGFCLILHSAVDLILH